MSEGKLFEILKQNIIPDLKHTKDKYEYYDCSSEMYNSNIELKCRSKHYPTFLIEKNKYEKLIQLPNPRYIVSTPEGIFSFNIKKIKTPIWEWKYVPKSFHDRTLVYKQIGFLDFNHAKELNIPNLPSYNHSKKTSPPKVY